MATSPRWKATLRTKRISRASGLEQTGRESKFASSQIHTITTMTLLPKLID